MLTNGELERMARAEHPAITPTTIDMTWPLSAGEAGLTEALDRICAEAHAALDGGANLIVLCDRALGADRVAIPSLLGLGAVHHDLVRAGRRLQTALVVESGEPREIHHLAALIGFGAVAVNPYLMFESLTDLHGRAELPSDLSHDEALERLLAAIRKGLLKVISKMGIATIQSYCGAQIFEAVGLDHDVIERCFTGTPSAVGGVGLGELAREALERHARAYPAQHHRSLPEHVEDALLPAAHASLLPQGGVYAWRRDGERHAWDPATIAALQLAVRANGRRHRSAQERYEEFRERVNSENGALAMLRGLLDFKPAGDPIPIEEVESTATSSALHHRRHEPRRALTRGTRDAGGRDEPDRRDVELRVRAARTSAAIRPIPTATSVARGSSRWPRAASASPSTTSPRPTRSRSRSRRARSPARAASCPATRSIRTSPSCASRHPGVGLISPPPHHDIYSIEDLKQLIYDLRGANPTATVSVALAAEAGVGTVAAGVAKAAPTMSSSRATTAARAPRRCRRSSRSGCHGRSASPRPSRRCCETTCARGSSSRSTAACAPGAT